MFNIEKELFRDVVIIANMNMNYRTRRQLFQLNERFIEGRLNGITCVPYLREYLFINRNTEILICKIRAIKENEGNNNVSILLDNFARLYIRYLIKIKEEESKKIAEEVHENYYKYV